MCLDFDSFNIFKKTSNPKCLINFLDMVKKESNDEIQMQTKIKLHCSKWSPSFVSSLLNVHILVVCCFKWTTIYLYLNEFLFVLDLAKYSICKKDCFVHSQQIFICLLVNGFESLRRQNCDLSDIEN